jgi:hypothetical protein
MPANGRWDLTRRFKGLKYIGVVNSVVWMWLWLWLWMWMWLWLWLWLWLHVLLGVSELF